jgi:hypothetical protein
VRQTTPRSGQVAGDVPGPWETVADPTASISNPDPSWPASGHSADIRSRRRRRSSRVA